MNIGGYRSGAIEEDLYFYVKLVMIIWLVFYIKFKRRFNKEPKVNKIPKANINILKKLLPSQINMIMLISISVMPHIKYIVPPSDSTEWMFFEYHYFIINC